MLIDIMLLSFRVVIINYSYRKNMGIMWKSMGRVRNINGF